MPALLKAIAEKLIPGIPEDSRIAILQQTKLQDGELKKEDSSATTMNTRQEVIERATSRSAIEQDIKCTTPLNHHVSTCTLTRKSPI